jgi:NADPH:quinone reductase
MTRTAAVAYRHPGPPEVLEDVEIDVPDPRAHDLLVEIHAVSVNPADVKSRAGSDPGGEPKVLGYDASGVVAAIGEEVSLFEVGDEVFYAGSIDRQGTYAGLHIVDERIAGRKPKSLDFADAAAMPLTSITAWEVLFDRLALTSESAGALLVVAAAGGVGSMISQFARKLTKLTVFGTAARGESEQWALRMGVHGIVDRHDLVAHLQRLAPSGVDYIFSPFSISNVEAYAEVLRPRGQIVAIDEPDDVDLLALKPKSLTWHWEFMFTRPLYEPESTYQHELLDRVALLVDAGEIVATRTRTLQGITAATLQEAHREVEESASIGKLVVAAS